MSRQARSHTRASGAPDPGDCKLIVSLEVGSARKWPTGSTSAVGGVRFQQQMSRSNGPTVVDMSTDRAREPATRPCTVRSRPRQARDPSIAQLCAPSQTQSRWSLSHHPHCRSAERHSELPAQRSVARRTFLTTNAPRGVGPYSLMRASPSPTLADALAGKFRRGHQYSFWNVNTSQRHSGEGQRETYGRWHPWPRPRARHRLRCEYRERV